MKVQLPTELTQAIPVLNRLLLQGHVAVFVGGAVRDHLLQLPIADVDIATSATPEEVMQLFEHVIPTGLQHGTVTVIDDRYSYEITTFRKEAAYVDHRRPTAVQFVKQLDVDLSRRDFTMNAMALTIDGMVIDPFFGLQHLENRKLYAVGYPAERFAEDALRMLRAIRFVGCYELQPALSVWKAIVNQRTAMQSIAMERVQAELDKLIGAAKPDRAMKWLYASGLLAYTKEPLLVHIQSLKANATVDLSALALLHCIDMRWAALAVIMGLTEEETMICLQRLRFARTRIQFIQSIVRVHRLMLTMTKPLAKQVPLEQWMDNVLLVEPRAADSWLKIIQALHQSQIDTIFSEAVIDQYSSWLSDMPISTIQQLEVNGYQLMEYFSMPSGKWLKELLDVLLHAVVCRKINNEVSELLQYAACWKEEVIGHE